MTCCESIASTTWRSGRGLDLRLKLMPESNLDGSVGWLKEALPLVVEGGIRNVPIVDGY
jgi:hypothetical protein